MVEHAKPAPANEAIVDRLVRTVGQWRVVPPQPGLEHKNNPTDQPPVIDPRNSVRTREVSLDPTHLRYTQYE